MASPVGSAGLGKLSEPVRQEGPAIRPPVARPRRAAPSGPAPWGPPAGRRRIRPDADFTATLATRPACSAPRFVFSKAAAAQAYSVPRMAKPTAMTRIPGPGSTSMASPAASTAPPATVTAIRFELRPMNRMISIGFGAMDGV